jgi:hypothetical protein
MNTTLRKVRWIGISLAALIGVLILFVARFDWNWLKHPLERVASAKLGRSVTIAGDLQVRPWSWTPAIALNGLTLGPPPWEPDRPLAKVERLEIQVKLLPLLGGRVILDPDHPYPFDLHILAGDIKVISDGRVLKPFNLADLDFNVILSGQDLAEGFYLTQLALPNTPPFKLHAHSRCRRAVSQVTRPSTLARTFLKRTWM